jgi:hypothetical protein
MEDHAASNYTSQLAAINAWFAAAPDRSAGNYDSWLFAPLRLAGVGLERSNALDEKAEIPAGDGRAVNVLVDAPSQWIE